MLDNTLLYRQRIDMQKKKNTTLHIEISARKTHIFGFGRRPSSACVDVCVLHWRQRSGIPAAHRTHTYFNTCALNVCSFEEMSQKKSLRYVHRCRAKMTHREEKKQNITHTFKWISRWARNIGGWRKPSPQILHTYGLTCFGKCWRMWYLRRVDKMNDFGHKVHWNFFSPVWRRMCVLRYHLVPKRLWHSGHSYGRMPTYTQHSAADLAIIKILVSTKR